MVYDPKAQTVQPTLQAHSLWSHKRRFDLHLCFFSSSLAFFCLDNAGRECFGTEAVSYCVSELSAISSY